MKLRLFLHSADSKHLGILNEAAKIIQEKAKNTALCALESALESAL
jgi:ribosomal protein S7